ncbi:aldo/keto reductase [Streptomyces sp. NPDC020298]|uniref:aldo/keto reductase n=1 Tax=unclassified Streptomyces TaxID=2593676 RepID=UPI0033C692ED
MAAGKLAQPGSPVADLAAEPGATPAQVALSWLLHISPVVLPIPGTTSLDHLTENLQAAKLSLTDDEVARLNSLG